MSTFASRVVGKLTGARSRERAEMIRREKDEVFHLSERAAPHFQIWQRMGEFDVQLVPYMRHEVPVRFYWLLAHPMSGYYLESEVKA